MNMDSIKEIKLVVIVIFFFWNLLVSNNWIMFFLFLYVLKNGYLLIIVNCLYVCMVYLELYFKKYL